MQESEKEMIRPFRKLSEGRRMSLKDEFALALLPTVTILAVLGFFELMGRQPLPRSAFIADSIVPPVVIMSSTKRGNRASAFPTTSLVRTSPPLRGGDPFHSVNLLCDFSEDGGLVTAA